MVASSISRGTSCEEEERGTRQDQLDRAKAFDAARSKALRAALDAADAKRYKAMADAIRARTARLR